MSSMISILGCGWLGLPLGRALAASGFTVKGSTTTSAKIAVLNDSNIIPCRLTLNPSVEGENVADFFKSDVLVVTVPFKRSLSDPRFYLEQMRAVTDHATSKLVIFTSSTLVYPSLNQTAHEEDVIIPADERARVLLETEQLFLNDKRFSSVILRLAGLYGPDREIANFLKLGRTPKQGDAPVNLVHLDDCIGVIQAVIAQNPVGEIFNVCGDGHPVRRELYAHAAAVLGLQPPAFDESGEVCYKIIGNSKVKDRLSYRFKYPSPLDWIGRK